MGFRISLSSLFVVVFAAIPLAASGNARAQDPQYTIETIVLTGDVAPGTGGSTYSRLDAPAINETGDVVFRGYLDGDITDYGFWTRHAGNLALVARIGDESPNSGGRTFSTMIIDPNINELGEVIFWGGDTIGGLDGKRVVWAGSAGALTEVVRHGDPAPGTIGRTFSIVTFPRLNDLGNAAFRGLLNFGEGIWRESNGVLELVALEGDAAPQAGGGTFSLLGFSAFNTAGQVAFRSVLGPDFIEAGLWVGEPNNLELIALTGPAGGLAPGTGQKFRALSAPNLNAAGAVVFEGFLEGSTAGSGVWAGQPGALELVALTGQVAPGSDGKPFAGAFLFPVINTAGEVAFRASLDPGSFEIGIWVRSGGILNFVTRTGIDAPGTIGRTFDFFNPPVLNAVGEVAFDAVLDFVVEEPPGPFAITTEPSDPATSQGIWAGSPDHLGLVIRAGDVLEVRPGDFRKVLRPILGLFASGNDDSRGSTFNNAGQVVFAAVLEDGSEGIFVASRLVAKNDLVSLPKGKTITIDVLANDMDPFGDGLSVVATGLPSNGAVTLNPDDTVTYSRNGSFKNGCDEFTYAVLDSRGRTHEGLVQVAVGSGTCGLGPTGTLKGTVKKDGKRISGASVRLDPGTASERQVTTNKAGKYGFDSVPAGIHTFTATDGVCGVEPFSILVTAGQTFTYDAKLVCP